MEGMGFSYHSSQRDLRDDGEHRKMGENVITEIKARHGEKVLQLTVTSIITEGIKAMLAEDPQSPIGKAVDACLKDIIAQDWNDIRAIIKRSL